MNSQHSARVAPHRIRVHDSDLSCDVRRVFAYRAECGCGWVGSRHGTHREAREDAKLHMTELRIAEVVEATGGTEAF